MSRRNFGFVVIMILLMCCVVALIGHRAPVFICLLLVNLAAFAFGSKLPHPAFSEPVVRNAWGRSYWLWAPILYWFAVLIILGIVAPIYEDGYGPEPSFWWGEPLLPDGHEYYRHHLYYNVRFILPYCIAAAIMTYLGCIIAPRIVRHFRWLTASAPAASASIAGLLILLAAAISDIGMWCGLWHGPMLLSFQLSSVVLPAGLLSGILALGRKPYEICERDCTTDKNIRATR